MKFILGKKLQMSQVFKEDGNVVPVTIVVAGPCVITQVKKNKTDRYSAVQIGFGHDKKQTKSRAGHLKGLAPVKTTREFRVEEGEASTFERGQEVTVSVFESGDVIQVTGISKGKGFAGVVKRHGFHGQDAQHGNKDQVRMPGSAGATGPARVFKGKKMPGRMGGDQVTVTNLEVVKIDVENNLLFIKGAVPGGRNGLVSIVGAGEMKLNVDVAPEVEETKEAPMEEVGVAEEKVSVEPVKEEKKDDIVEESKEPVAA